jgi:hypothetical protein
MLTRRDVLNGSIASSVALVTGAAAAQAFSIEPMPFDVRTAYALRCSNAGHDQLIEAARTALAAEIARGQKPVGFEEIVVCPICGCKMVVSDPASR